MANQNEPQVDEASKASVEHLRFVGEVGIALHFENLALENARLKDALRRCLETLNAVLEKP